MENLSGVTEYVLTMSKIQFKQWVKFKLFYKIAQKYPMVASK